MEKHQRVGVVMGGVSAERDVSLRTGNEVSAALERLGYDVVQIVFGTQTQGLDVLIRKAQIDVAFLALHGRGGEDGCVQGLLELLGIPYTGSGVLGSALTMDKLKAKELFRFHNVPTPPYYVVGRNDSADIEAVHASFGFPTIVKPRGEGSSIGLKRVETLSELREAIASALEHDTHALVERFIKATEVHVGMLDGNVLGSIEIIPRNGLYDYASKITPGAVEVVVPPRLPPTRMLGVLNLAERAASALECRGACRIDLLVTEGENEYVLEVNALPELTYTSLFPQIAAATGMGYDALCEAILNSATLHAGLPRPPQRFISGERPLRAAVGD